MADAGYPGEWGVWTDGEDWVCARSAAEAVEVVTVLYGDNGDDPDDWELLPGGKTLRIWEDFPGNNEKSHLAADLAKPASDGGGLLASGAHLVASRNV